MPYYRIVVWTRKRKKPYQGIRFINTHHINAVQGMVEKKAANTFHSNLIACEVQMLSKMCRAVKNYIEKQSGKKIEL